MLLQLYPHNSMIKILVTGSRGWKDKAKIFEILDSYQRDQGPVFLLHGDCPNGADSVADRWATINRIWTQRYPAKWVEEGKGAGLMRNIEMINNSPDLVLAFWDGKSAGTKFTITKAKAKGLKVKVYSEDVDHSQEIN